MIPRLQSHFTVRVGTLTAGGHTFDELARAGVPTFCAERQRCGSVQAIRELFRRTGRPLDIVVTWSTDALVAGSAIAAVTRASHLVHEHSGIPITGHRLALTRAFSRGVDRAVAVSRSQLPLMNKYGFRPERTAVVPNGVDLRTLVPRVARDEMRHRLGIDRGSVVAVTIANPRPVKRLDLFAAAVSEARRWNPRVRGLIVGAPTEDAVLGETLMGDPDTVQWLGARTDIGDVIAAADLVCLTSDTEALPVSLIEAAACRRPVIATNVGGVPDVVKHGETGLLVPRGGLQELVSALLRLAADRALRESFGEAGHRRCAAYFEISRTSELFAAEMFKALSQRRKRASIDQGRSREIAEGG